MLRFIKSLWSSTTTSRMYLAKRRNQYALRAVVASQIPSLVVILTTAFFLCDCRSEKNRTSDVTVDQPWHEPVSKELPVDELPPLPPVDQQNGKPDPSMPNVALGTKVIFSSHNYGPQPPDENWTYFSVEKV